MRPCDAYTQGVSALGHIPRGENLHARVTCLRSRNKVGIRLEWHRNRVTNEDEWITVHEYEDREMRKA